MINVAFQISKEINDGIGTVGYHLVEKILRIKLFTIYHIHKIFQVD